MKHLLPPGRVAALLLVLLGPVGSWAQDTPQVAVRQLEALSEAFRAVHDQVAPAVVLVQTSSNWERHLPRTHPRLEPRDDDGQFSGLGSGVVLSEDGYILSNYHVVKDADSINVVFQDRRRLAARIVGVDSLIDIALLKVEATNLPVARLGSSAGLRIGDWVLAIGHPLGMGATLTHGIVSALGRDAHVIGDVYGIESFIQTNAVINPGNSGGPLLDLQGRVVGINTAISTRTGYYIGYGLAVPIDLVSEAVDDLLTHGRIIRGYLGVSMEAVDDALVRRLELDLDPPRGVLLKTLQPGAAADLGGVHAGDVLLSIDGKAVNVPNQVQTLIYRRDPGDRIDLELLRDGHSLRLIVELGERAQDRLLSQGLRQLATLGITVAAVGERAGDLGLTTAIAAELGLGDPQQAVVIVEIDSLGPAAAKGLQVGDIVAQVDQAPIASLEVLVRTVTDLRHAESALVWLWHKDRGIDVRALRLGASGD